MHTAQTPATEEHKLEELLQGLWDRVHQAGEAVQRYRSEQGVLLARLEDLERELATAKRELASKEQIVISLSAQQQAAGAADGRIMTNGEREALAARVRDLLSRIEGYL
jgi:chromosome segregation ATPase